MRDQTLIRRLKTFVVYVQTLLQTRAPNEHGTSEDLVVPFLDVHGWTAFYRTRDYPLTTGSEEESYPDRGLYTDVPALIAGRRPRVLVEDKGADSNGPLTRANERQLLRYLRTATVEWGLLTNGEEYRFYRYVYWADDPYFVKLVETDVDDLFASPLPLLFRRDNIDSHRSRRLAEALEQADRHPTPRVTPDDPSPVDGEGPYEIEVASEPDGPTFRDDSQVTPMVEAVSHLFEVHDLRAEIDLPYRTGPTRALIRDKPDRMRSPKAVTDDLVLETHWDKTDKRQYLTRLAEACGVALRFNAAW